MATADELLGDVSVVDKTLVISNDFRTINIPSSVPNLGVEYDDDVLRLDFKMPRYVSNTDLSNFVIRINYINSKGETDAYTVSDNLVGADYITFSWLVGPTATRYKGNTKFIVCAKTIKADGTTDREFNTTIATLPVLEGLEVDESIVTEYSDIIEQWRKELFGIGDTEEASIKAASKTEQDAIANKGAEVLATIPVDYQTAVSMADNADRTKADAIICSTQGETIRVNDSSDDYIRGLKIFGRTDQIRTTGKNLLPNVNRGAYGTKNGLTFTDLGGGIIDVSGIASANTTFVFCSFSPGERTLIPAGTYTLSGSPGSTVYLSFYVYADQETSDILTSNASLCNGNTWTFTLEEDAYYGAYLYVASGKTACEIIHPQLELGSIATEYEPYSGGIAAPCPERPQDLVSINEPNVHICGRNLCNLPDMAAIEISGVTWAYKDGAVIANGSATAQSNVAPSQCPLKLPAGTYTVSGGEDAVRIIVARHRNTAKNYFTSRNGESATFDVIDEDVLYLYAQISNGSSASNITVYPVVNAGTTAMSWAPYKEEQALELPYSLSAIPVKSDGNYTDVDGQSWICDEIDLDRGVYIQRVGTIVFDGSVDEYWFAQSTRYYTSIKDKRSNKVEVTNALRCSHFKTKYALTDTLGYVSETYYHVGNVNILFNFDNGAGGVDNFVSWLQSNPITVQYVLATPIETSLSAEEIEWFRFAHTNYPNTTILNDATATMELEYNADTKVWLDNAPKVTDEQAGPLVEAWMNEHFADIEGVVYGKSAYEIAVERGFVGSEAYWLASLKGKDGFTPVEGVDYYTTEERDALISDVVEDITQQSLTPIETEIEEIKTELGSLSETFALSVYSHETPAYYDSYGYPTEGEEGQHAYSFVIPVSLWGKTIRVKTYMYGDMSCSFYEPNISGTLYDTITTNSSANIVENPESGIVEFEVVVPKYNDEEYRVSFYENPYIAAPEVYESIGETIYDTIKTLIDVSIMAEGTSGDWYYSKRRNGIVECWAIVDATINNVYEGIGSTIIPLPVPIPSDADFGARFLYANYINRYENYAQCIAAQPFENMLRLGFKSDAAPFNVWGCVHLVYRWDD